MLILASSLAGEGAPVLILASSLAGEGAPVLILASSLAGEGAPVLRHAPSRCTIRSGSGIRLRIRLPSS